MPEVRRQTDAEQQGTKQRIAAAITETYQRMNAEFGLNLKPTFVDLDKSKAKRWLETSDAKVTFSESRFNKFPQLRAFASSHKANIVCTDMETGEVTIDSARVQYVLTVAEVAKLLKGAEYYLALSAGTHVIIVENGEVTHLVPCGNAQNGTIFLLDQLVKYPNPAETAVAVAVHEFMHEVENYSFHVLNIRETSYDSYDEKATELRAIDYLKYVYGAESSRYLLALSYARGLEIESRKVIAEELMKALKRVGHQIDLAIGFAGIRQKQLSAYRDAWLDQAVSETATQIPELLRSEIVWAIQVRGLRA